MEIFALSVMAVFFYMYLNNYNKKKKTKEMQEVKRAFSDMKMGEVLYRIAQIKTELKQMGILTEKQKIIWEALESRRMELKETSTPESIAQDLEELALMERYNRME